MSPNEFIYFFFIFVVVYAQSHAIRFRRTDVISTWTSSRGRLWYVTDDDDDDDEKTVPLPSAGRPRRDGPPADNRATTECKINCARVKKQGLKKILWRTPPVPSIFPSFFFSFIVLSNISPPPPVPLPFFCFYQSADPLFLAHRQRASRAHVIVVVLVVRRSRVSKQSEISGPIVSSYTMFLCGRAGRVYDTVSRTPLPTALSRVVSTAADVYWILFQSPTVLVYV